ncbi:MAG TPA: DUF3043 domain-containing protein [Marmoricola sp.]|nr:DUF3043 domain-containing protein [Marmoricola sp.]HNJ78745.1 DUF3043 domain-containing protein [Marmoricola sp.]HNO40196.1 DUF3043 domain-containing protein [Marmoricola sp.]
MLFRRSKSDQETTQSAPADKGPGAKGRPTPTRKEAEAAARARARAAQTSGRKKPAARGARPKGNQPTTKQVREAMRTGDERFLPPRDQGPVKRFVRNWIDSRISISEFMLPLLILIMVLSYSGNAKLMQYGTTLWTITIVFVLMDVAFLMWRLRRALRSEFPDESIKGTTFYAIMRLIQLRWLRLPKPQVKVGGSPKQPKQPK